MNSTWTIQTWQIQEDVTPNMTCSDNVERAFNFGVLYLCDMSFWHSSEASIKLQVLSARQEVTDGIKLRTVAHQLMNLLHFCKNTEEKQEESEEIKHFTFQTQDINNCQSSE